MPNRILVVAHERPLRTARIASLEKAGCTVRSVASDDDAVTILEREQFDLILLGRRSLLPQKGIAPQLRGKAPALLTLKIEERGMEDSPYPSWIADFAPPHLLDAVARMVGDDLRLIPLNEPADTNLTCRHIGPFGNRRADG